MSEPVVIEDAADARLAPYRDLRAPDSVARRHGFIVEGRLALERTVQAARHPLASVLLTHHRAEALATSLAGLPPSVAVYATTQRVMDEVCGFSVHRGVLAHGRPPEPVAPSQLLFDLAGAAVIVGLVGLNDVENLGSVFRNAAALGARAVLLDASCCDPLYRRAIRVSVGTTLVLPFARLAPGEDMIELLRHHDYEPLAFTPAGATRLADLEPASRTALLFGSEGPGLPPAMLREATTVRIPMANGCDSLNVATTSGIALHHVLTARES